MGETATWESIHAYMVTKRRCDMPGIATQPHTHHSYRWQIMYICSHIYSCLSCWRAVKLQVIYSTESIETDQVLSGKVNGALCGCTVRPKGC